MFRYFRLLPCRIVGNVCAVRPNLVFELVSFCFVLNRRHVYITARRPTALRLFSGFSSVIPEMPRIVVNKPRMILSYPFQSLKMPYLPYILESNPHPFYSFRGLKNQMRIRIPCGLYSRSRAGFWKNDTAAVRAVRTIQ